MKMIRHIQRANEPRAIILAPILLIMAVIFIVTPSCSSLQEGKVLFESKCAKCHPLDYSFREKKSLAEWHKTAETMARYSEGFITKKEAKKIAKYLANI